MAQQIQRADSLPQPQSLTPPKSARQVDLFDRIFMLMVYTVITVFALFCVIPFLLVVSASITPEADLRQYGFQLIPPAISFYSYEYVLQGRQVLTSYTVTVTVTVLGTAIGMAVTVPFSYVLASKKAKYARFLSFMTYFTMIFGGGLIGTYILITRWLGLKDNILALILPYLLNPFYAFILVSYFRTLPQELIDAATIDGANDIVIFWRIALPLAKPAVASVALFYALRYWNDWWLTLLFIDNPSLHGLQTMIRQIFSAANAAQYLNSTNVVMDQNIPTYGVQMSTVILTIGPIILLYPFVQRYFVRGLTLGAVKG